MSAPIGPGDWVEFVGPAVSLGGRKTPGGWTITGNYHVGFMTIVEAVTPAMRLSDGRVVPGLRVRGVKVHRNGREGWYPAYQWRPVYRPRADLIESLKVPPEEVRQGQSEDA